MSRFEPPEGAVVGVACLAQAMTFGLLYTFGVVLEHVQADLDVGTGAVALVPAVAAAAVFFAGPLAGRLADGHGAAWTMAAAAALLPAGLVVTSLAPDVWAAVLGFGLLGGLGAGFAYVPTVAHIASLPSRHAGVYVGVVVAGVGVGPAVLAPALAALSGALGWRGAYRLAALAVAVVLAVAATLLALAGRPSAEASTAAGLRSTVVRLWRAGDFVRLYAAMLAVGPSLYVGLLFLPSYVDAQGLAPAFGAALVAVLASANALGRVALTVLTRRVALLTAFRSCIAALAASLLLWVAAGAAAVPLIIAALLAGMGYGGVAGLAPSIVAARQGSRDLGATLGLLYTALGIAGLATGPAVGAAIDYVGYPPGLVALAVLAGIGGLLVPGGAAQLASPSPHPDWTGAPNDEVLG